MTEATIHLVFKPVDKLGKIYDLLEKDPKLAAQHAFILHTRSNGDTYVYRGGPSVSGKDTIFDIMIGDLHFIKAEYKDQDSPDFNLDWKTKYPNILLDKGNDNKLDPKAEELVTFGNWIHEQKLDYKLPIGSERQNSNMLAKMAVESMGYKFVLPKFTAKDGKEYEVHAPGYDQKQLSVTLVDKFVLDIINNPEKHTAALYGMYADPAALYNQLEEAKQLSLKARKLETPETKVEVTRKIIEELLSFKNTAAGSCTVDVETGGSCTAETSFTTNDYTTQSTFASQPPAYKSLFETLDKKGIILDGDLNPNKKVGAKTHVVEKGDTVWSIAHKNEIGINELLLVSGNEKYLERRYIDERGKDNIKLYKDDIINLPSSSRSTNNYYDINKLTEGFNRLNLHHQTSFKDKIFGSFELGNYGNYQELQTYLLTPFLKWSSTSQFKTLDEQLQFFKNLGFEKQFQYHNADYKLEQKVEEPLKFFKYFSLEEQYGIHLPADHVFKFEHNNNYRYHSNNYQWKSFVDPMKIRGDGHWETEYYGGSAREQARYVFGNSGFSAGFSISGFGRARPIGVSLDEEDISLVNYEGSSIFFDIDGDGYKENTAWVSSTAAILVYDYNNNGIVDEAKKIVFTEWSNESKTDLEALKKAFDSNNDNIFDSKDKEFDKFYIWQDYNQNGISENNELTKLEEIGIQSINLNIISENDEGKKNQGILGTSDIIWKNGKITKAYDLIFKHSLLGIKAEQINSDIIINYIEKGDQLKFFVPEVGEGNVNFNSKENDYDVILGTAYDDIINISQNKGVLVDAGDGDDVIKITSGNNWVKGGAGKDSIITGSGHDLLFIDADDIEIDAGEGFDVAFVTGDKGINIDIAKSNIEAIYGSHKDDNIDGSRTNKNLQIYGGDGDDTLIGGNGDDIIVGGKGKDKIIGGKGDDKIFIDNEDNLSDIDAGEGNDTIYLLDETGITIDLDKIDAENFFGNKGNDIVIARDNKDYILFGGEGDDDITGGTSNTILDGGKGNDILRGGSGNNKYIFSLGYGHDTIHAAGKNRGDKKDLVLLSSDIQLQDMKFTRITDDLVLKVKKDDSLTIKNWYKGDVFKVNSFIFQADQKDGGKEIILYDDTDKLNLKDGNDWIVFTTSKEDMLILGGSGNEFIKAGQGNDFIVGWGGNDTIYGGAGNDFIIAWDYRVDADKTTCPQIPCNPKDPVKIYGEEGDDILMGAGGDDLLDGGDGNDTITGLGGNDILITGSGDDIVRATEGNNKIIVNGAGDKTLYSGSGSDEFIIKHMEHGSFITIVNFDMNDQNEKIDFTAIKSLHSLQDFPQIFDYDTTIEFPTIENPNNVETFPCACISWAKSEELYNHCWLVLTDITAEQVLSHPEKFIFGE